MIEDIPVAPTQPPPAASTQPPPPAFGAILNEVTAGSLIRRTFEVWASHVVRFSLLSLSTMVPIFVGAAGIGVAAVFAARGKQLGPGELPMLGLLMFAVVFPLAMLAGCVQMGGLAYGAFQQLAGRPVRMRGMIAAGVRRLLPIVGAMFLMMVAVMGGMLLLIVPGVILGMGFALAVPAIVVERLGPIDALGRSWELTRGHRGAIFGAMLAMVAIAMMGNIVMQLGARILGPAVALVGFVLYILMLSLPALVPAVAYHDLRVAREGLTTDDLVKVFE